MREIPSLQTLCLRSVGPHACSADAAFAPSPLNGEPSTASRLLRSFHRRAAVPSSDGKKEELEEEAESISSSASLLAAERMARIPLARTPCIGPGSARRVQANEVDLHHPWIAGSLTTTTTTSVGAGAASPQMIVMCRGSAALDCLQSYIDSLVELGRMDDCRLGRHFWDEWKAAIELRGRQNSLSGGEPALENEPPPLPLPKATTSTTKAPPTKRPKRQQSPSEPIPSPVPVLALGSLSLHNCVIGDETLEQLRAADLGPHLAVLDLTGVRGLTDELLSTLFPTCRNLRALSLKNCRRITSLACDLLGQYQSLLEALDVGGAFNIPCDSVVNLIPKVPHLLELHASGLGWTDDTLAQLVGQRDRWKALSLSFSTGITPTALRQSLPPLAQTLTSLALAFCESTMDNAALGLLGRNLPHVVSLDVRGNPGVSTMTGWYDGRVSADLPSQRLVVLGRYSGLSDNSIEETKRIHPVEAAELVVVLDGGGMGAGITRLAD